ncbi:MULTISPECIES: hypothetical protein [Bradyrhizobium]|uniref:hypothetical protein n=1 Tax=Bradyrhizobium TaxID=374 RepID=UPI00155F3F24|nr:MULTISPECIES: hypothetical protein [Bradyrhizobium]MDD1523341.1 hypothetical protein [Bradyrhizobium sp. WBAH30]MDD1547467.1 hypothetical protein [Bradyrhizobium sp. WBAH41]MDD1561087.1 hypothetical protein [Bradyrhizobium sp. WBAH23]MDD1567407.1 hypothetical protein [Bradyrhizobium sp. WBAH33]MDD1594476.1 hypothetical protein [Bradyrhizobium sp. WBAH42]
MLMILGRRASPMRLLGLAAAATLMLSAGSARRAEALTLINPATSPVTKAATDDLVTQVRHGGHGGHGGGGHFHGGGFRGGGGHIGGFRGGGFHGGGFRAAPAFHGGGIRYGGFRHYGGHHRHWGYRPHYGYRHFHRRYYYGGYYPYYHYPRRCRIIWTYYGPRRVCRWPRWHYPYRYYW